MWKVKKTKGFSMTSFTSKMAKTQKIKEEKIDVSESSDKEKQIKKEDKQESLVRILNADIPGSKNLYAGLTKIKGISFSMSNAICHILNLDKRKRVESLSKEEIEKLSEAIKTIDIPKFMKNRRFDFDTGEDKHLLSTDLELRKDFDIKRLKKIKSYKGNRHSRGLPLRGQRTKSHFRTKGKHKAVGVKKKR